MSKKDQHVNETSQAKTEKEEKKLTHLSYEELEAKLNETENKMNQYYDQLLRMQAEMDNVRRRAERDIANAHKYGSEKIIEELLAVADSLELGLSRLSDDQFDQQSTLKSMREGMTMTLTMLLKALEKFGVKQINPVGEAFNPAWHQAISTKEDPKTKHNTVLEVLQKGYLLQDRLLRPALVVVAK